MSDTTASLHRKINSAGDLQSVVRRAGSAGTGSQRTRKCGRATYVQQQYAIDNPRKFKGYCWCCWGITASDGYEAHSVD